LTSHGRDTIDLDKVHMHIRQHDIPTTTSEFTRTTEQVMPAPSSMPTYGIAMTQGGSTS